MTYHKILDGNYILAVGQTDSPVLEYQNEITAAEYNQIIALVQTKPADPEGYRYVLSDSTKEWELVALPTPDPDPDAEDSDILSAIGGVL